MKYFRILILGIIGCYSASISETQASCPAETNNWFNQVTSCYNTWQNSGSCGEGCTYTYENGNLTVKATKQGAVISEGIFAPGYYENEVPNINNVIIDGEFSSIGNHAFLRSGSGATGATISGKNGKLVLPADGWNAFGSGVNLLTGEVVISNATDSIGNGAFYGIRLDGTLIIPDNIKSIGVQAFYNFKLAGETKIYCAVENCAQKMIDSCKAYGDMTIVNYCLASVNSFISDPDKFEQAPAGCAMYSASGCSSCSNGYHDESGTCVMNTCDYISELSVCEDSIEGCTRNVCAAGTTLADGTSCYVKQAQDITPTCGNNAHVVESDNTCSCVCDSGYSGDGTECTMLTCAEMFENSTDTCENSVSGCSVTTCTEVGTLVDGETKCYTSSTVDHTPTCGENASVVGTGTECSCQCDSGYSGDGTTCTMLTCEDLGKMSSCSDSVVGCEKTTCSENGTLADGITKCYTSEIEDITPSCDTHASLNQQSCSCSCNEGYEGDGETCQAISCAAGQYLDGSECKQCAAGSYAAAGDNHCSACADGAYSAAGSSSCSPRQNTENCTSFAADSDTCTGCNSGYHVNNGACLLTCPDEQVLYKGECLDEYPFAKKHYTPAEANKWLKDDDNTITLLFKK